MRMYLSFQLKKISSAYENFKVGDYLEVWETMSSYDGTMNHTTEGKHSKTSVLDLGELHFLLLLSISWKKSKRIKETKRWLSSECILEGKRGAAYNG